LTHVPIKLACVLAALSAGALTVAGCGDSVPSDGVAKVGDKVITTAEFQKWLKTAALSQSQGAAATTPDPPRFTKCIAAKRGQPQPGGGKPTDDQLRKQCKQEYDQVKSQVMQFLIQAQWVVQEADKEDIKVSNAEVQRSFQDQKKQAFPTEKAYQRFLRSSGMSQPDILFRVKLNTLQQRLTQKITQKQSKVTDADISSYYDKNRKRFAQPERRNLKVVLTKSRAKAVAAKAQLARGQSFKKVAKKYSIDQASKAQGGTLPDVAKGQQEKALDRAVFKARKGKLTGPVKTQFGWYVFEVTKVTRAAQQSEDQAKPTIRNLLRSQRQQKTLDDWIKDFRERYRNKTTCASGYKIPECKNGPKKTSTGPASGGAPGGPQQPQQAPGQPGPTPPSGGAPPSGGGAPPSGGAPQGPPSP
jgi:foldase protein PrsA